MHVEGEGLDIHELHMKKAAYLSQHQHSLKDKPQPETLDDDQPESRSPTLLLLPHFHRPVPVSHCLAAHWLKH